MFRIARLLVPLTSIAALAVVAMLLLPRGAAGGERTPTPVPSTSDDQYLFGHDALIEQPVHGNVQVYFGNVFVHNVIEGDLLVYGGDVTVREPGRITGKLIHGGGNVTGVEGRVGRVYSMSSLEGATATLTTTAIVLSLLFVWLVTAVIVTVANDREIRYSSIEIRSSALHCFALGLVALTSFVLTAIVFSYLVPFLIGIPLLAALGVFAILTKIYGMVSVFHAVGTLVAGSRTREQLVTRKWLRGDIAMVVIGVLILGAIRMIPVVGPIVWGGASVFGVGVALATKFGRREPWFLAWRPAEA
jgi:hypothetical protein